MARMITAAGMQLIWSGYNGKSLTYKQALKQCERVGLAYAEGEAHLAGNCKTAVFVSGVKYTPINCAKLYRAALGKYTAAGILELAHTDPLKIALLIGESKR